jgi:hypothetical protein
MRILTSRKGVSTLMIILLLLVAAIIGGLLTYMWSLANFYYEPSGTNLAITEVDFPVGHSQSFNVTVFNPSSSASGTNITEIFFTVEGDNSTYDISNTFPERLPIPLDRATSKTITCSRNWGDFAGKNITVHVNAEDASGATRSVETTFVKLDVQTSFNITESVRVFTVTATDNRDSAINLTIASVLLDGSPVDGYSIELPRLLAINETITFQCYANWEGDARPEVTVQTFEGYRGSLAYFVSSAMSFAVTDITFNKANSNEINVTVSNGNSSSTLVDIANITIAYGNSTDVIDGTGGNPHPPNTLPYRLNVNTTVTFVCNWNWTNQSLRDIDITATAYALQGFVSDNRTVKTPSQLVAEITDVRFDIDDTSQFFLNLTNAPTSLYSLNVTSISLNQTQTTANSSIIPIGNETMFTCGINWSSYVGSFAIFKANVTYNVNVTSTISNGLTIPYFKIRGVVFSNFPTANPYANVTVYTSAFSTLNANITRISIQTQNGTISFDGTVAQPKFGTQGYNITIGNETTFTCPVDWAPYFGQNVTVIVQSADGFQATTDVQVSSTPP